LGFVSVFQEELLRLEKVARFLLKAITASRPRLRYPAGAPAKALITMKRLLPEGVFVGVRKMIFSE